MHIHSYSLENNNDIFRLELGFRLSTDADGISICLGLQADAKIELEHIIAELERKISKSTLLTLG